MIDGQGSEIDGCIRGDILRRGFDLFVSVRDYVTFRRYNLPKNLGLAQIYPTYLIMKLFLVSGWTTSMSSDISCSLFLLLLFMFFHISIFFSLLICNPRPCAYDK